jgi:hypothetical protein
MTSRFRRLRRLRHSPLFIAALVLFLTSGAVVGGTFASFTAETQHNISTYPTGWIGAPTSLSMTASGTDGSLTWTPATHGLDGQTLTYLDNGTSSSCTSPITTSSTAMTSAATATYTQANAENTTLSDKVGNSTLNGGITATATALVVTSAASFPSTNGFTILIGTEQMTVTAGAGTTSWTVTRHVNGTVAATHANAAAITQVSISVASASAFPGSGSYAIEIGTEQMTVTSGAGTTTWAVTRGVNSTVAAHASGAVVVQLDNPVAGHYFCDQMTSTLSGSSWNAAALFPATQLGLYVTGVVITNSGTANSVTSGDTIAVTFNQPQQTISTVAANTSMICESWDASTPSVMTIYLYHAAYGTAPTPACSSSPVYDVALTGLTITHAAASVAALNATIAISGNTVTWTVKTNGKALAGQATITGATSNTILSTNGGNDISSSCTTASPAGLCTQTATGTKF